MEYNRLGRSNMVVSKVCLGTMHFGPKADEATSHAILDRALELGINFIDTANVYGGSAGFGRSEEIIGSWFARRPDVRDQVVLATKQFHGQHPDRPNGARGFSAYRFRQALIDSLRRLQTDRIDLYQTHHIDRTVTPEEFWGTYDRAIADGDVLYAGSSNFSGWGLATYQQQAWQRGSVGFISEQTQYNLLSRVPEMEVLPAAEHFGIGGMVYMPLAGGLLTGKVASMDGSRTAQVEQEYGISLGTRQHPVRRVLRTVPRARRDGDGGGDRLDPAPPGRRLRHRGGADGRAARRAGSGGRAGAVSRRPWRGWTRSSTSTGVARS